MPVRTTPLWRLPWIAWALSQPPVRSCHATGQRGQACSHPEASFIWPGSSILLRCVSIIDSEAGPVRIQDHVHVHVQLTQSAGSERCWRHRWLVCLTASKHLSIPRMLLRSTHIFILTVQGASSCFQAQLHNLDSPVTFLAICTNPSDSACCLSESGHLDCFPTNTPVTECDA